MSIFLFLVTPVAYGMQDWCWEIIHYDRHLSYGGTSIWVDIHRWRGHFDRWFSTAQKKVIDYPSGCGKRYA